MEGEPLFFYLCIVIFIRMHKNEGYNAPLFYYRAICVSCVLIALEKLNAYDIS